MSQVRIRRAKIFGANSKLWLVAWKAEISHSQIQIGERLMQRGLKPVVVLHPLAQFVTDQANMVAFF